ncbi:MAG: hypothetical protein Hyperionvirus13_18 [Hyperionvirus sp.]|uniref:DUF7666 domain-containing protein n=1 Tax=Hyperionvirus sp. TaxID=2487770 RepID=A0A3G5A9H0_9VIRU|nr:MAG: hypothetical protein Hyperionvirus13_18 [Hyperionvirus sp.]
MKCGYKIVDRNLCGIYRYQYEVGKSYKHEGKLAIHTSGFHYCERLLDCISFCENYGNDGYRYLYVEDCGDVIREGVTCVTDHILITLELTLDEIKFLMIGVRIDCMGTRFWYKNGLLDRDDGAAIEYRSGKIREWFVGGLRHRSDGPAVESPDEKRWYFMGVLHRDNGPAVENINGTQLWYKNGKLHREDGPAAIYPMGYVEFYKNNKRTERSVYTLFWKTRRPFLGHI